MSKMKKIFAVLISLVMVLGMCVTTFAAGATATITVGIIDEDGSEEVTMDQIVEPDTTSVKGWKFSSLAIENVFKTAFSATDANAALDLLFALAQGESVPNKYASDGTLNPSKLYGDALSKIATTTSVDSTFTVNKAGLYLINVEKEGYTFAPMVAYVRDTASGVLADASVTAKGSPDQVWKMVEAGGESVSKGDIMKFSVEHAYPFYTPTSAADDKPFVIQDTLTNATFGADPKLVVKIDDVVVHDGFNASVSPNNVLTIKFIYNHAYAGKTVKISYEAIVGEVSSTVLVSNKATSFLRKGNTEYIVNTDTVKFIINKYGEDEALLEDAEFTLYESSDTAATGFTETVINPATQEKKFLKAVNVGRTGEDGSLTFEGLDAQKTYYVQETEAPMGYSINNSYYLLSRDTTADDKSESHQLVGDTMVYTTTYTFGDFDSMSIMDTKLSSLPSTGGIGTTIFTFGGCMLMIAAAGFLFTSRKKSQKQ